MGTLAPAKRRRANFSGSGALKLADTSLRAMTVTLRISRRKDAGTYALRSVGKGFPRFKGVVQTTGDPEIVRRAAVVFRPGAGDRVTSRDAQVMPPKAAVSGCFVASGGRPIQDICTGMAWETKNGADGVPDPHDLHDADNAYAWAGLCAAGLVGPGLSYVRCQPNPAAAATCRAIADGGTYGCDECGPGEGRCTLEPEAITTVWDWLNQVNVEAFGGYSDWRLPSEAGRNACVRCGPRDMEAILRAPFPCGTSNAAPPTSACVPPLFDPMPLSSHWSATTTSDPEFRGTLAVGVAFGTGQVADVSKNTALRVRAVRRGR